MATDAIPNAGEVIASKYEVERVIGSGGMGVVMAARHVQLGHRVAIKFLRRDAPGGEVATVRFLREARAAVAITSEHVAKVLDVGALETGLPYIVMEFPNGSDLAAVLKRVKRMPTEEAVDTVLQACEALAEAHAMGIIHRDLKPSNLFVAKRADGTPLIKILDFGISKRAPLNGSEPSEESLTAAGHVIGSAEYMSPEQVRDAKGVDGRSDIWALGVILYELLSGSRPFVGQTLGDTLAKILTETPAALQTIRPDVSDGLGALVRRCLERSLPKRVQSIGELAAGLRPFATSGSDALVERILRIAGTTRSDSAVRDASSVGGVATEEIGISAERPAVERPNVATAEAWLQPGRRGAVRSASTIARKSAVIIAFLLLTAFVFVGAFKHRARPPALPLFVARDTLGSAGSVPFTMESQSASASDSATRSLPVPGDAGPPKIATPQRAPGRRATPPPRPSATVVAPNPEDLLERRR